MRKRPVDIRGSIARNLYAFALCAAASALAPFTPAVVVPGVSGLAAQTVTGAVLDATTSEPLQGVLISLLDVDGERVRAVLSDDAGRFGFEVESFGRYRLRAERIGLQATTSQALEVFGTQPHFERILMGTRAVEIAGLVVDTRVRQCRLDRERAVQIQRWWLEVRTALDVSSVVQGEGLAEFEIERYERSWGPELEKAEWETSRSEVSQVDRPFVSAEAAFLSEGGYVQGDLAGQREYYAPDADVLLSDVFLSEHCFSLSGNDDEPGWLGLAFEPSRDKDLPDIRGTLWVDTTTAELKSLDFRYENLGDGVPDNESGGFVSFEYLPWGAWIVRDWYIRMPRFGLRSRRLSYGLQLLGYLDVGGRVSPMRTDLGGGDPGGPFGSIRGVVWDSIRGQGLAGAGVTVLGTRARAVTNADGAFTITDVPVGEQRVAFYHDDPEAWGLGSPFVNVDVRDGATAETYLALPSFAQAARIVCLGSGASSRAVLVGNLVDAAEEGIGNVTVEISWELRDRENRPLSDRQEVRTGSDGRFVACTVPNRTVLHVRIFVREEWIDAFQVTIPRDEIAYRWVKLPLAR